MHVVYKKLMGFRRPWRGGFQDHIYTGSSGNISREAGIEPNVRRLEV